ncbi:MAG: hypothetical protein MUE55_06255 [Thermoplasmata archaeon]|nr:hypothetical protein [Thermoplasmata archaeon]
MTGPGIALMWSADDTTKPSGTGIPCLFISSLALYSNSFISAPLSG